MMCKNIKRLFCALIVGTVLLIIDSHLNIAAAETRYVDASASTGGDGTSWSTAFKYLQDAIQDALDYLLLHSSDTVEIHIAAGAYYPDEDEGLNVTNNDRTESFHLHNHVQLLGGYAGSGATRAPATYVTILSGDIDKNSTLDNNNSFHVVTAASSIDDTAIIDGCTIKHGYANGGGSNQSLGGGILIDQGHPKIRGCTITVNHASSKGGGIMSLDIATAPEIRNCKITANTADGTGNHGKGGGMQTNYSVKVINSLFNDNYADDWGGGFSVDETASRQVSVELVDCQFVHNEAEFAGGGIYADALGSLKATNCLFNWNAATSLSSSSNGGGLWTSFVTLDVVNCTIVHCEARNGAGGGFAA